MDILIFTNINPPSGVDKLKNVIFHNILLEEFIDKVKQISGYNPSLSNKFIYKLCDYKPLYGLMFHDYIKEYDFWAYGDEDLFFGDLFKYLPDEYFNNYEIISAGTPGPNGPLTFFKNNDKINNLFINRCKTFKLAIEHKLYLGFDEWGRTDHNQDNFGEIIKRSNDVKYIALPLTHDDILDYNWQTGLFNVKQNWCLYFKDGKLFRNEIEIPMFHFIVSKQLKNNEKKSDIQLNYKSFSDYTCRPCNRQPQFFRDSFNNNNKIINKFFCDYQGLASEEEYNSYCFRNRKKIKV